MSQNTRRTWISILIAAVIIVGILAVAAIGGVAFFIHRHVNTQFTGSEDAAQQFQEARARFAGQRPLIEIQKNDRAVLHREATPGPGSPAKLERLRVIAYDDHAGKLLRISIPFWLLRLMPSKNSSFLSDSGIDFDSERVHLTLDDLERRGPGLILDQADRRGSQVLVWSE